MSAQNPDHSPERLIQYINAFVKSIGKPVGVLGWGSCHWVPVAAHNITSIAAVAAYDPGVDEVMGEEVAARFMDVVERMGEAVAEDRLTDAAEIFVEDSPIYTPEEVAEGAPSAFWRAAASNIPVFLKEAQQAAESGEPGLTDPSVLEKITVPVLLLNGERSHHYFADSVRYIAEHVSDCRVREIAGAGHFGPYTKPEAVAEEFIRFFTEIFNEK